MTGSVHLSMPPKTCNALALCAALGVLHSIQRGTLDAEAGIWTVGRPRFWRPLAEAGLLPTDAIEALGTFDEIDGLARLGTKKQVDSMIKGLIKRLENALDDVGGEGWDVTWEVGEPTD